MALAGGFPSRAVAVPSFVEAETVFVGAAAAAAVVVVVVAVVVDVESALVGERQVAWKNGVDLGDMLVEHEDAVVAGAAAAAAAAAAAVVVVDVVVAGRTGIADAVVHGLHVQAWSARVNCRWMDLACRQSHCESAELV